jgi:uncharacterized membrane protein
MVELIVARILHVIGVVLWIGGVAMVTTVLLPATRRLESPEEREQFFERIEAGFARQARWTTLITGLSGFYLAYLLDAWDRFRQASYWWMHAMVLIWAIFMLMLFVLEPSWLHRWFEDSARRQPERTFTLIQRLHWLLLSISLMTVAGAVAGSHGWLLK